MREFDEHKRSGVSIMLHNEHAEFTTFFLRHAALNEMRPGRTKFREARYAALTPCPSAAPWPSANNIRRARAADIPVNAAGPAGALPASCR